MKVLHVISSIEPEQGGPTSVICGLLPAQRALGHEVELVATFRQDTAYGPARSLERAGVKCHLIGPTSNALGYHRQITPVLQELVPGFDIVHVHALFEEVQHRACALCRAQGKPYVVTPHGMLSRWVWSRGRVKKTVYWWLRLCRNIESAAAIHFTTSGEQHDTFREIAKPRQIIVPLGIDPSAFPTDLVRGVFRKENHIPGDAPLVAFLGRIHPGKGLEYLVPAMARMSDLNAHLVVIGPDSNDYRSTISRLASESHVQNRVVFTGILHGKDKLTALNDADVFCLPSDHENFGLAVLEALAMGLPAVVSTAVNFHHEIAEAGIGASVARDPQTIADALRIWLTQPGQRSILAHQARAFVADRYSWNKVAQAICEQYIHCVRPVVSGCAVTSSPSAETPSAPRTPAGTIPVSILMPVRNASRTIAATIGSVLSQTYPHFEFIIIDDGSDDSTPDIVAGFAAQDARIRFVRQANCGLAASLNTAIALAQYEWLARIDADDLMAPNRLERQVWFIQRHPDLAVAGSFAKLISEAGEVIGSIESPYVHLDAAGEAAGRGTLVSLVHPSVLMRKSSILAVGGYRPFLRYAQDIDLWNRIVDAKLLILVQPEYLTLYRTERKAPTLAKEHETLRCSRYITAAAQARRRGEPEIPWEQFVMQEQQLRGVRRLNLLRRHWGTLSFWRAQRAYRNQEYWNTICWLAVLSMLQPAWTVSHVAIRATKLVRGV